VSEIKERMLSISEAQREITSLPEQFTGSTEPLESVIVTRYGKPVMAIMSHPMYKALLETIESLQETLEIMKDAELMAGLRESIQQMERGETIAWEDVEKELDRQNEMERTKHTLRPKSANQYQRYPHSGPNPQAY
jgi:antitoxin YefM